MAIESHIFVAGSQGSDLADRRLAMLEMWVGHEACCSSLGSTPVQQGIRSNGIENLNLRNHARAWGMHDCK